MNFKKLLISSATGAIIFGSIASSAFAATGKIANDANPRSQTDTYSNFVIVDTNHPASQDGYLGSFSYYAANTNPFRFILVNANNKVLWESNMITPPGVGYQAYAPSTPVVVKSGSNLGVYFQSTGTIPFEFNGAPAEYQDNNTGLPAIATTLKIVGSSDRTYSYVGNYAVSPSSFGDCNNKGYQHFINDNGQYFTNIGDCVAYVATHLHRTDGNVTYSNNPTNNAQWGVANDGSDPDSAVGAFAYTNTNHAWYFANARYLSVSGKTAWFSGPITSSSDSAHAHKWLVVEAVDNSSDMIGTMFVPDQATAQDYVINMISLSLVNASGSLTVN